MKDFIVYQDDNGKWVVTSERIPGFSAKGASQEEALEKMKQAMKVYYPCGECKGS